MSEMINSAEDYAFVDFANGDLPTANIDGHPMPLRSGDARDKLMAEDVAFLWECIADKANAFAGARCYNLVSRESGTVVETVDSIPDVSPFYSRRSLTRRIVSGQMRQTRDDLVNLLSIGLGSSALFYHRAAGFLKTPLVQVPAMYGSQWASFNELSYLDRTFGGHWDPTTDASDFASGAKVRSLPIMNMFDDARKLVMPVGGLHWIASLGVSSWEFKGTGEHSSNAGLLWYMVDAYNIAGYGQPDYAGPIMVADVPQDYIDPQTLQLWACVTLRNQHGLANGTVRVLKHVGLYCLTPGVADAVAAGGRIGFITTSGKLHQFCEDMITSAANDDVPWSKFQLSGDPMSSRYQSITIENVYLLLSASPSGRTKWWSD